MLKMLSSTDVICTRRQLATILGITSRRIDTLTAEAVLKPIRCSSALRGKGFRLAESVQNYQTYNRACLAKQFSRNGDGEYEKARSRRMTAIAGAEELHLQQVRGELLNRARVVHIMTSLLTQTKNHMLGLPARLTRQLIMQRDPQKVRQILDKGVRNCLIEASKFGSHSFDEHGTSGDRKTHDS